MSCLKIDRWLADAIKLPFRKLNSVLCDEVWHDPNIGVKEMAIYLLLADAFALYIKTKNFHWLEAGDDLGAARAVCEKFVYEDDILRLRRCLGAGNRLSRGKWPKTPQPRSMSVGSSQPPIEARTELPTQRLLG